MNISSALEFFKELEKDVVSAYDNGVSVVEAEKLAIKFLSAQMKINALFQTADLDARMKKSGHKRIKAAVRIKAREDLSAKGTKVTDSLLEDIENSDGAISDSQSSLDHAEHEKVILEGYLKTFQEAHIFFRGVSKGQ